VQCDGEADVYAAQIDHEFVAALRCQLLAEGDSLIASAGTSQRSIVVVIEPLYPLRWGDAGHVKLARSI
jgi:hypothetical protein